MPEHPKEPLTLVKWAALGPVTYAPESNLYPTLKRMEERCRLHEQAAPRLLAALRGLPTHEAVIRDHGDLEEVVCLADLRALIEQTDLAAPEQAQ